MVLLYPQEEVRGWGRSLWIEAEWTPWGETSFQLNNWDLQLIIIFNWLDYTVRNGSPAPPSLLRDVYNNSQSSFTKAEMSFSCFLYQFVHPEYEFDVKQIENNWLYIVTSDCKIFLVE